MRRYVFLFLSVGVFISFLCASASASKRVFAVREQLDVYEDFKNDKWYATTASILGTCKDVNSPLETSDNVTVLYSIDQKLEQMTKLKKIGQLYFNNGQEVICLDDFAFVPFVEKNVIGENVFLSGWVKPGSTYSLECKEIMILESLKLINNNSY